CHVAGRRSVRQRAAGDDPGGRSGTLDRDVRAVDDGPVRRPGAAEQEHARREVDDATGRRDGSQRRDQGRRVVVDAVPRGAVVEDVEDLHRGTGGGGGGHVAGGRFRELHSKGQAPLVGDGRGYV